MTVPVLGSLSLSGFQHPAWFLFLPAIAAAAGLYVLAQRARRRRVLRFANLELLDRVAPTRSRRRHHLPAILLVVALVFATVGLAGPTQDVRTPRSRAVVMLLIQVSPAMRAADVEPDRLTAAQQVGRDFVRQLTPGINLGLIAFSGSPTILVSPTTDHHATSDAINKLQVSYSTAIGDAIFTALQAIATVGAVLGNDAGPPPARIVLVSTGRENHPAEPDNPRGAFTAARAARDQGVPISTIAIGTPEGVIDLDGAHLSVPVEPDELNHVADLSGGHAFTAATTTELSRVSSTLQQQIGYQTVRGDASTGWLRLSTLLVLTSALAALALNRRLPI